MFEIVQIANRIQSLFPQCKVNHFPEGDGYFITCFFLRGEEWYEAAFYLGNETNAPEIEEGILNFTKEVKDELEIRGLN